MNHLRYLLIFCLLLLAACGYRIERGEKVAISVPYVVNDYEGALTEELARAISRTANFHYTKDHGDWILNAKILKTYNDRIGYRYDRGDKSGKRRSNIVGTENRKEIMVEVSVIDELRLAESPSKPCTNTTPSVCRYLAL